MATADFRAADFCIRQRTLPRCRPYRASHFADLGGATLPWPAVAAEFVFTREGMTYSENRKLLRRSHRLKDD
jgi:hypothetical protein